MSAEMPEAMDVLQDAGTVAIRLLNESERGCVLVAAAYIEDLLALLLRTHFRRDSRDSGGTRNLFKGYGPLSSFSAKIAICYQLELIDASQRSALTVLRRIRNDYAHLHKQIEFDSDRMKEFCRSTAQLPSAQQPQVWEVLDIEKTPRATFVDGVISHSAALAVMIEVTAKRMVDQMRSLKQEAQECTRQTEKYKRQLSELKDKQELLTDG